MKKTIKTVVMATLCFAGKDSQLSLKAQSQAKNPIRILAQIIFEELKLIVIFHYTSVSAKGERGFHTSYYNPLSLLIHGYFK